MRRKTEAPAGLSQNYQRFAWGTVVLAALVALSSTDRGTDSAAEPVMSSPVSEAVVQMPKMARPDFAVTPAEPSPNAGLAEEPAQTDLEGDSPGDPKIAPAPPGTEASMPASAPHSAGPASPAQAGQLIASSHARSGSTGQGDDPGAPGVN